MPTNQKEKDIDVTPIGHLIDDAKQNEKLKNEKEKMTYFPNPTTFPPQYFLKRRIIKTIC